MAVACDPLGTAAGQATTKGVHVLSSASASMSHDEYMCKSRCRLRAEMLRDLGGRGGGRSGGRRGGCCARSAPPGEKQAAAYPRHSQ